MKRLITVLNNKGNENFAHLAAMEDDGKIQVFHKNGARPYLSTFANVEAYFKTFSKVSWIWENMTNKDAETIADLIVMHEPVVMNFDIDTENRVIKYSLLDGFKAITLTYCMEIGEFLNNGVSNFKTLTAVANEFSENSLVY